MRGLYQHSRNLGLEPGEELLAAMQARALSLLGGLCNHGWVDTAARECLASRQAVFFRVFEEGQNCGRQFRAFAAVIPARMIR